MRILLAGFGSVLRGDDGFGVAVVNELLQGERPNAGVRVIDAGIAGIRVVQELTTGYDALIIVDTVQRNGTPGQIYILEPEVPEPLQLPAHELRCLTADMHLTEPSRVLLHAKALNVLPAHVWLVGCEPACTDEYVLQLSPAVRAAVPRAVIHVRGLLESVLASELT